jgi:hypothetical protein
VQESTNDNSPVTRENVSFALLRAALIKPGLKLCDALVLVVASAPWCWLGGGGLVCLARLVPRSLVGRGFSVFGCLKPPLFLSKTLSAFCHFVAQVT